MTPLARFLAGLLSTALGKVSVVVLGLLALMITTRAVPPADVGIYVLFLAVVLFLTEFSALGINLAVAQRLVADPEPGKQDIIIGTALSFRLASSVLIGLAGYAVAGPLFTLLGGGDSKGASEVIVYLPLLVVLESIIKLVNSVLQGRFRFRAIGIMSVLGSVTNVVGIVLLVLILGHGLVGLILAKVISRGLTLAYGLWAARMKPLLHLDRAALRGMLRFGLPLEINFILSYIFMRTDTFLIGVLLGPIQVAFFDVARRIPGALGDAYDAFVQVYFPFISELVEGGDKSSATQMVVTSVRWIAFGALIVAVVATLFGQGIIVLLFGNAYLASVPAFPLLCVSLAAYLVDSTLGYALIAAGSGSKIPLINSIRAVAALGLYFVFISRWGLQGAAAAAIVSIALVLPLNLLYLRAAGIRVNVGVILRPFAVYTVLAILASLFAPLTLVVKIIILLAYPLASLVAGVVKPHEVRDAGRQLASFFVPSGRSRGESQGEPSPEPK